MRFVKWVVLALLLVCLTACGQKEVRQLYTGTETEETKEVIAEAVQELPAGEYSVSIDGEPLEGGGVVFGGEVCVNWNAIADALELSRCPVLTIGMSGENYVLIEALCEELGYELLRDDAGKNLHIVTKLVPWQIPEGYEVPVLMYHGVSDDLWGMTELFVRPANMEAQIRYLVDNGYTPIWFEDLVRVDEIEKPVILTFDDGYMDNYLELFPILQKYNVKATVFVVTGTVDYNPRSLTAEQIREMSDSGLVSIQSHTVTHPYLNELSREAQEYELAESRRAIFSMTGKVPNVICYPSGRSDENTIELAQQYYNMGINMNGNQYITGEDPYRVDRYYIRRQDGLGTIISYIQ